MGLGSLGTLRTLRLVIPTYQRWMPVNEMSQKRRRPWHLCSGSGFQNGNPGDDKEGMLGTVWTPGDSKKRMLEACPGITLCGKPGLPEIPNEAFQKGSDRGPLGIAKTEP